MKYGPLSPVLGIALPIRSVSRYVGSEDGEDDVSILERAKPSVHNKTTQQRYRLLAA